MLNVELADEEASILINVLQQVSAPVLSKESEIIRNIYNKLSDAIKTNKNDIQTK